MHHRTGTGSKQKLGFLLSNIMTKPFHQIIQHSVVAKQSISLQ
jgi:hypothetical protein